jgi:2-dehydro-3-deoxy-D-arabinonate dehydratase
VANITDLLSHPQPESLLTEALAVADSEGLWSLAELDVTPSAERAHLLKPMDKQEVWAAGVTYRRSQEARMEESEAAASCYDRVYDADRPELFLKATPHRAVGPNAPIIIRKDSTWNVPEPELTLVISPRKKLVGFTVGNDVSSRSIEGENPLYLPQAKTYVGGAAVGPVITLAGGIDDPSRLEIELRIGRGRENVFRGSVRVDQLKRSFDELIDYLGREQSFPYGVLLMTGTGVVPASDFTLQPEDLVEIEIDQIGTLSNPVAMGRG